MSRICHSLQPARPDVLRCPVFLKNKGFCIWAYFGGQAQMVVKMVVRPAGYIHQMAVRRSAPGLGVGLLDWAQQECLRHGRRLLRLDRVADNLRLLSCS
jgi:hypothetical protein